jgi:hypothetical protein
MKELIKGWLRPIGLIQVFVIVGYSIFFEYELSGYAWAWVMLITGFYYAERAGQNVINTYRQQPPIS